MNGITVTALTWLAIYASGAATWYAANLPLTPKTLCASPILFPAATIYSAINGSPTGGNPLQTAAWTPDPGIDVDIDTDTTFIEQNRE